MSTYVLIDIFKITAVLELDLWRLKETKPMYGAMLKDDNSYYSFTNEIRKRKKSIRNARSSRLAG